MSNITDHPIVSHEDGSQGAVAGPDVTKVQKTVKTL